MIQQPDCWLSPKYDKSFGPLGQWDALRKLKDGREITDKDAEWLAATSASEVDGAMIDMLAKWKEENMSVTKANGENRLSGDQQVSTVVHALFSDIGDEIEAIKSGTLTESKAREVAKFRTMQLRSMELMLQAGHLEVKARKLEPRP